MKKRILLILAAFAMTFIAAAGANGAKEPIKVLAIGNSFSQDAVEQYLWELAEAEGVDLIIGNMYIGGCSFERHAKNSRENIADYEYRKIGLDGVKTNTKAFTLEKALADEEWDYVSVQQVSGFSGMYETFHPYMDEVLAYVKARIPKDCKIMFHQTWAYQGDSNHTDFPKYNKDQMTMYNAIMTTEKKAMKDARIKIVIPSGTAVQNARTSFIGDHMTRDGFHMNLDYGRYTVACVWFEVLTGKSVIGNKYAPANVTAEQKAATQAAAHAAVRKPWKVTPAK